MRRRRNLGRLEEDWLPPGELLTRSPASSAGVHTPVRRRTRRSPAGARKSIGPRRGVLASPVLSEPSSPDHYANQDSPYASPLPELALLDAAPHSTRRAHRRRNSGGVGDGCADSEAAGRGGGARRTQSDPPPGDAGRAASHCRRALRLQSAGRQVEAARHLDSAVRLAPRVPRYWQLRATAHRRAGDEQRAVADATTALELDFEGLAAIHAQLLPPARSHHHQHHQHHHHQQQHHHHHHKQQQRCCEGDGDPRAGAAAWSRSPPNEELWQRTRVELSVAAGAFRQREAARVDERRRLECAAGPRAAAADCLPACLPACRDGRAQPAARLGLVCSSSAPRLRGSRSDLT
jgi:hypothetical protein